MTQSDSGAAYTGALSQSCSRAAPILRLLAFAPSGTRLVFAGGECNGPILITARVAECPVPRWSCSRSTAACWRSSDVLVGEPANPHDPRAVGVGLLSGERVGYLPRRCNEVSSRLLDHAMSIAAGIAAVEPDPTHSRERLTIAVRPG